MYFKSEERNIIRRVESAQTSGLRDYTEYDTIDPAATASNPFNVLLRYTE